MAKALTITAIAISFVFSLLLLSFSQDETLTITTYYPSPYGVYREMRAQRMAIGEDYIKGDEYCWAPDSCTNTIPTGAFDPDVDLVIKGNVGIGTTNPQAKLDVNGGVKLGSDSICNSDKAGTMRYNAGIEYCDGSNWKPVGGGQTVQAWATFNGATESGETPFVGFNVKSVVFEECSSEQPDTGGYYVYWDKPFASTNYAVTVTSGLCVPGGAGACIAAVYDKQTDHCYIEFYKAICAWRVYGNASNISVIAIGQQ